LAADLLITDYSSVMFDYVVTGKPVVLLAPDLEQYRDQIRGFYLDLEEIAPGPICRTNEELSEVLSRLGETVEAYSDRYQDFTTRFVSRDDGAAAARVVDVIWGSQS
jgi:CDP-glycerol glycerophosphotransferase